jgi:hypothetical protein
MINLLNQNPLFRLDRFSEDNVMEKMKASQNIHSITVTK